MTPADLKTKLDELLRLPAETEWVEFKEAKWNFDFDDLGKYFVALDKVQKRKPLTSDELKHLRRLRLVEGRAPNVFVASKIAAITGDKAQYIRNRAFDTHHYKQMILDFIHEFGSATRKDVDDLLKGKLSDLLTSEQQTVRIKNLLAEMARKDGTIRNLGSRTKPDWKVAK